MTPPPCWNLQYVNGWMNSEFEFVRMWVRRKWQWSMKKCGDHLMVVTAVMKFIPKYCKKKVKTEKINNLFRCRGMSPVWKLNTSTIQTERITYTEAWKAFSVENCVEIQIRPIGFRLRGTLIISVLREWGVLIFRWQWPRLFNRLIAAGDRDLRGRDQWLFRTGFSD